LKAHRSTVVSRIGFQSGLFSPPRHAVTIPDVPLVSFFAFAFLPLNTDSICPTPILNCSSKVVSTPLEGAPRSTPTFPRPSPFCAASILEVNREMVLPKNFRDRSPGVYFIHLLIRPIFGILPAFRYFQPPPFFSLSFPFPLGMSVLLRESLLPPEDAPHFSGYLAPVLIRSFGFLPPLPEVVRIDVRFAFSLIIRVPAMLPRATPPLFQIRRALFGGSKVLLLFSALLRLSPFINPFNSWTTRAVFPRGFHP